MSRLGKSPKDYDLATNALPDKVEEMMNTNNIRTIATAKHLALLMHLPTKGNTK
jgi:tRNA nucleotidyltransferase/poly(A) polymerase